MCSITRIKGHTCELFHAWRDFLIDLHQNESWSKCSKHKNTKNPTFSDPRWDNFDFFQFVTQFSFSELWNTIKAVSVGVTTRHKRGQVSRENRRIRGHHSTPNDSVSKEATRMGELNFSKSLLKWNELLWLAVDSHEPISNCFMSWELLIGCWEWIIAYKKLSFWVKRIWLVNDWKANQKMHF